MEQKIPVKSRSMHLIAILAVILSLYGALISTGGAVNVYQSQVTTFNSPMWPLPGLFLLYWAVLGIVSFTLHVLIARSFPSKYLYASWAINGAFIPLILLGALSIGSIVLISFGFFLLASILLLIYKKAKLFTILGFLLLGLVTSAIVSLAMIAFGNPQFLADFPH